MKGYSKIAKLAMTVMLLAAFFLLSGFRAQTIIHDDGSETQDVLKVSATAEGQQSLKADADEFQKRNYTIMDYSNDNGEGFRAMKTITNDGASRSSVDHIVHKTHDGLFASTYYINYNFDANSIQNLRLGAAMPENGVDLEYMVSFPSGTQVTSNSTKADDQASTYLWQLSDSQPSTISLQATVWHKLFIYMALFLIGLILIIVLIMEHRRKSVISWKRAAQMRRFEMMLLCVPIVILGYMGYEYYVGTHVTTASLDKVAEQQEELLENREEDRKMQEADARKQRSGELAAARIRSKASEISNELRSLKRQYRNGAVSGSSARSQAQSLAQQAREMLSGNTDLSQADRDVLEQLINSVVSEAESIGDSAPAVSRSTAPERQRSDAAESEQKSKSSTEDEEKDSDRDSRSDASKSRQSSGRDSASDSDESQEADKTNK
ncbi:hypothetical protein [Megasphaera sp.]|uniref:hypothetical protein n=1 Tax=Megasphaera sp. TaxID=2023260 RepID=UPI0027B909BE|nr:hypothetical protein [Megasphaera sp.]